jgi:hypothetical protein
MKRSQAHAGYQQGVGFSIFGLLSLFLSLIQGQSDSTFGLFSARTSTFYR